MSTRQTRLQGTHLRERISDMVGKTINVVLLDNAVLTGKLQEVHPTEIVIQNMRLKKVPVSLNNIYEIYFDVKE
ncbi:MAG: hypothetical protein ACOYXT_17305 [Bacteroidota bacterium]